MGAMEWGMDEDEAIVTMEVMAPCEYIGPMELECMGRMECDLDMDIGVDMAMEGAIDIDIEGVTAGALYTSIGSW